MLFNSYVFIFVFLPISWIGFQIAGRVAGREYAIGWLVAASLFFYGYWNPVYLQLILASIFINYAVGALLIMDGPTRLGRALILLLGLAFNLGLLGYFKYANFFVDSLAAAFDPSRFQLEPIVLPLAISFFTFQQIAYLVDAFRGQTQERNFFHYSLFIVFFPQLIAGPIVHHKEMLPQFARDRIFTGWQRNLAVGLTIFSIGLAKKVIIADTLSVYAGRIFQLADAGAGLSLVEAWGGTLAYTFQLYFDFSGYSDMAIGIGWMFGIRLPLNFFSPYKANSIIEFWRRWHMTLSRFLRDYVYFPLGGNRKGPLRRHVNLLATMLLGGLWHGAGWTFVVWGGLHGLYLIVNHAWRSFGGPVRQAIRIPTAGATALSRLLTFAAVIVAWVFFRAESFDGASTILYAMAGLNGILAPLDIGTGVPGMGGMIAQGWTGRFGSPLGFVVILFAWGVAWYAPNTQEIMSRYRAALDNYSGFRAIRRGAWWEWVPSGPWALASVLAFVGAVSLLAQPSEFLYFQF